MEQHPEGESMRLAALESLEVLDTSPEPVFDELVRAAALLCNVPISLISLIDSDRQWFKANVGLHGVTETDREVAFCNYTIQEEGILEVVNALDDSRFSNNPLVTGEPYIRFYAGIPLRLADGSQVGSLCVIDRVSRQLTSEQKQILQHLSSAVVHAFNGRQAVHRLAISQARFQALSDSSPLGVFSTNAEGACTYTNERWRAIFKMKEHEAAGYGWGHALHPEDKEAVFEQWQTTTSQKLNFDMEFRIQHDSGTVLHVRAVSRPIFSANGEVSGHTGSVEDISERRRARQKIHNERQRLEAIIEGTGAGSWEWNIQTDEMRVNARWCELLGLTQDETRPSAIRIWRERLHPDDVARANALMDQHKAGDLHTFESEVRIRHRDGHWIWVVEHGRILTRTAEGKLEWMFGTLQNITQRKEQENALLQSERLLKETGMLANVGGWVFDIASKQLQWSDHYYRIHGLEPDYQPQMQDAISFYVPEDQPVIQAAVERALSTGHGWDLELRLVTKQRQAIWVRVVGHVEQLNGKPVRLFGASHDITDHVRQRKALEEAHERISVATESGEIGIWEWNTSEGNLNWTERMFALFGLPAEPGEVSYEQWVSSVHPDDRNSLAHRIQEAIEGPDPFNAEFRIIWADSSIHHLRAAAHITRDPDGKAYRMLGVSWDVSPLHELSSKLTAQVESLRVTLQSIGDAVIMTDAAGQVTWQNPIAEKMTEWLSDDIIGQSQNHVFRLFDEKTRQLTMSPISTCLELGQVAGLAHPAILVSRSGLEYGIEASAAPILDQEGSLLGAVLVFRNVTEQRRMVSEISYRASHDALTGLVNRIEFEARLRRLLIDSRENGSQHSLLHIDLDQFKLINDACGHSAGDQLLVQIAELFTRVMRAGDTLARLGGDEFGVILRNCRSNQASRVAHLICSRMDEFRFLFNDQRFRIGASIGLVPLDNRWLDTESALQAADVSCYAAKEEGRNRVHTWFDTDEIMRLRQDAMQWATQLEQSLDEDRFALYFQTIRPLSTDGTGVHVEILIRLREPDGRLVMPDSFLPAAERFNLITRIDRWVLQHAIEALRAYLDHTNVELFCINLSGQSIGDRVFHRDAIKMLMSAGNRVCSRVCIEITETAAVTNMVDATMFIEKVRALGVRIALDDFGAGASSFGYLRSLPVDFLKIDGQFIQSLIDDSLSDVAVNCFVDVARVMGMKTIAEYVDSSEILKRVKALGIDYAQGYLIHEPETLGCKQQESARETSR